MKDPDLTSTDSSSCTPDIRPQSKKATGALHERPEGCTYSLRHSEEVRWCTVHYLRRSRSGALRYHPEHYFYHFIKVHISPEGVRYEVIKLTSDSNVVDQDISRFLDLHILLRASKLLDSTLWYRSFHVVRCHRFRQRTGDSRFPDEKKSHQICGEDLEIPWRKTRKG